MKWLLLSGLVIVVSGLAFFGVDEFADTNESTLPATAAERGRALALERGCVACHSLTGAAGIGPTWSGLLGARKTFADGSAAIADETYLRRAMLQPQAEVVAGYDNLMLPAQLTDAQIADIIALIRELAGNGQ